MNRIELSETKYTQYCIEGDAIVLAKIQTMRIRVGSFYTIAKSAKWGGGNYCRVIKLNCDGATCAVATTDNRKSYHPVKWIEGEFSIPFDKFVERPF